MEDLQGHALEAHVEMYPTLFLCINRHGLIVPMMMIMTLRFAALVQDHTVTALQIHMTVVVDLRLAVVIQGPRHRGFIIPLSQVLVHLEWSRFFQRISQLNNQVIIRVNIKVNIQANTQAIIPVIFVALTHLLLLGVLLELGPLTSVHTRLVVSPQVATNHGDVRRQLLLLVGIPLQLIRVTDGHMVHPVAIVLAVAVVMVL